MALPTPENLDKNISKVKIELDKLDKRVDALEKMIADALKKPDLELVKTVDKRTDKLEITVANLEKSVKVLIDTRGDSKADALKKLELAMIEQSKQISAAPQVQIKALGDALQSNADQFRKLALEQRKAAEQELGKTEQALRAELAKTQDEMVRSSKEHDERVRKLHQQAEAAAAKRDAELVAQHRAMADKLADQVKAQAESAKSMAELEARFIRLEALVQMALAQLKK